MPVPVSEILNPTPPPPPEPPPPPPEPPPPPPPPEEVAILRLLGSKPNNGFSRSEVYMHLLTELVKPLGLDKPWKPVDTILGLIALAVLPKPKEETVTPSIEDRMELTLASLLEKGTIETREYNGVPHYWLSTETENP